MKALPAGILLTALAVVFGALAIEPPQPAPGTPAKEEPATAGPAGQEVPPAPAPREEPARGEEPAQPGEPAADEEELPPLPDAAPAGPPPQRFNPTEKVRADFPVSFPIDI